MTAGVFAFGKIPSVGDFFRLGAPQDFVADWDSWVQSAMLACQTSMGAAWDSFYMSAPIWRFALAPGLAGARGVAGVLMPSVDRVGRRFPLTLLCPFDGAETAKIHFANDTFYDRLEDLALDALEDDMTRDRLAEGLAAMPPLATVSARVSPRIGVGADVASLRAGMAAGYLGASTRHPSLWTARLPDRSHFMLCEGLPNGSQLQGLFNLDANIWQEGAA